MATALERYAGTSFVEITTTLASLTNGSYRQSASVDNTGNKFLDVHIGGVIRSGSVAPTVDTTIDILAYGQNRTNTDFTAGASGADAAYTADGEESLFKLIGSIVVDVTTAEDYEFGPWPVANLFGGHLPPTWGVVVLNGIGQTLDTTESTSFIGYLGLGIDSV